MMKIGRKRTGISRFARLARSILIALACLSAAAYPVVSAAASDRADILTYRQPAEKWASEALPIGNGRMGAMLFGGVDEERIQFNEQSLWSGDNNWDGGYDCGDRVKVEDNSQKAKE